MRDFTLKMYEELLAAALRAGFKPVTFAEYMTARAPANKTIILRHDVDRRPKQALKMARLERAMGVKASYYFRRHRRGFAATVIRAVVGLGHEIGYHYEDLGRARGDAQKAIAGFAKNLESLRRLYPVKTICMHGSPIFRFDNRDLWKSRDYHDFGIIGEPYFDIAANDVLYLTDTGRKWDGDRVSIRDKVRGEGLGVRGKREDGRQQKENWEKDKIECRGAVCDPPAPCHEPVFSNQKQKEQKCRGAVYDPPAPCHEPVFSSQKQKEQECRGAVCDPPALYHEPAVGNAEKKIQYLVGDKMASRNPGSPPGETNQSDPPSVADDWSCDPPGLRLHSTRDIINALERKRLPDQIMLTVHPQRWSDRLMPWAKELVWQNVKNGVKYLVAR